MTIIGADAITLFAMTNSLPLWEIFVAVAETEGFSAAARRLSLSKAKVSTAVSQLEQRLGVRLLQRSTRRLSLTDDGRATLPHAQRALQASRDAEEAASESRARPRGPLKVNAPMSFGLLHVAPHVASFVRKFPDVNVDLAFDDRLVDLIEGGFDLGVRIGVLSDSSLIAQRIGRSRMALVASAAYVKKHGAPRKPEDLGQHATLVYSLAPSTWVLTQGRRTQSIRLRPALKANSSLALKEPLLDGVGIARMPIFSIADELKAKRLVPLLTEWELPELPIHVVTTAREHTPLKTRAFVDHLKKCWGEPLSWERAAGL